MIYPWRLCAVSLRPQLCDLVLQHGARPDARRHTKQNPNHYPPDDLQNALWCLSRLSKELLRLTVLTSIGYHFSYKTCDTTNK